MSEDTTHSDTPSSPYGHTPPTPTYKRSPALIAGIIISIVVCLGLFIILGLAGVFDDKDGGNASNSQAISSRNAITVKRQGLIHLPEDTSYIAIFPNQQGFALSVLSRQNLIEGFFAIHIYMPDTLSDPPDNMIGGWTFKAEAKAAQAVISECRHDDCGHVQVVSPDGSQLAVKQLGYCYSTATSLECEPMRFVIFNTQTGAQLAAFTPGEEVEAAAFSPDGSILALAGEQGVLLWDTRTWQQIDILAQDAPVTSLAYSPDGKLLATGSEDTTVRLWDMGRRTQIGTLLGHTSAVSNLAFNADGTRLVSSGNGLIVWDTKTGDELCAVDDRYRAVLSSDGSLVAARGPKFFGAWREIYLIDVDSGRVLTSLEGHTDEITSIAFSPDGSHIMSASAAEIIVWGLAE